MRYSVEIQPRALKVLKSLKLQDRLRIVAAIELLHTDPIPPKATRLKGSSNYRIRVGNFRIIYAVESRRLVVLVIDIGHRREIYRKR